MYPIRTPFPWSLAPQSGVPALTSFILSKTLLKRWLDEVLFLVDDVIILMLADHNGEDDQIFCTILLFYLPDSKLNFFI